jgi:UDP-glucuronate 4-epimerase
MAELFCCLGDCNREECHNCFPVRNCSFNHEWCQKNGCCNEIDISKKILITGCAGFIGFHTTKYLLENDYIVYGIDNMNHYYDVKIKEKNIEILNTFKKFTFSKEDIQDTNIISQFRPYKIIHLASLAGVRASIQNPKLYVDSNIKGFVHILEESVKNNIKQIVYASSSSVYGLNKKVPFEETDQIDNCNSPYACSKMAMEIYAKTWCQLYDISCIGLRFFTVYGPHGRPDMAPYKFMKAIMNETPIDKYGDGTSSRDYTYVDDIVSGIIGALENRKEKKYEIYNLGNSNPVSLNEFIETCEQVCGKKVIINQLGEQLGDVPHTYASIEKAKDDLNYDPKTKLKDGLQKLYEYLII